MNVVAVTPILVLGVSVIGRHVLCHYDFMFPCRSYHARLRARGVHGALPLGRLVWGGLRCSQGSKGVWGAAKPSNDKRDKNGYHFYQTLVELEKLL